LACRVARAAARFLRFFSDPDRVRKVEFIPPRAEHLAGARGREDREFQRPCGGGLPPAPRRASVALPVALPRSLNSSTSNHLNH
jgi:hypothetical protein